MYSLLLEYRCTCHHLLFKGIISPGSRMQIKCKSCGKIVSLSGRDANDSIDDYFVLLLSDKGQIVDASFSAGKILGYQNNTLKTMSIFDIVPTANMDAYKNMWSSLEKLPDQVFSSDTKFIKSNGKELTTRSRFKRYILNSKHCTIVFYEVLNKNVDDTKVVFNSNNPLIFNLTAEVTSNGLFSYISPEFVKKIGVTRNTDILGKKIFDFLPDNFSLSLQKDFHLMVDIQKTVAFHGINFINQDEKFDFLFSPTHHPDNRIKGFRLFAKPHDF